MVGQKLTRLHLLFVLSIPTFFLLAVGALYYIELEEWVEVPATIVPAQPFAVNAPESGNLMTLNIKEGDQIQKDQLLATIESTELTQQRATLQTQILAVENKLKQLKEESTKTSQHTKEKDLLESKQLQEELEQLQQQLTLTLARLQSLEIHAPDHGLVLQVLITSTPQTLAQGSPIFLLALQQRRKLKIQIPERQITKIAQHNKIRFAPITRSIYESDYFWGKIETIPAQATTTEGTENAFIATATLETFGSTPLTGEHLKIIPFGATGKCAIAIGKKSLLKQLLGW